MAVEKWPEQDKASWVISFVVPKMAVETFEESFAEEFSTVSSFEIEGSQDWKVDIYHSTEPDEAKIRESVRQLGVLLKIEEVQYSIKRVEEKDWVIETIKSFPPISVGGFFVYGSHFEGQVPASKFGVLMDAGIAFGSGEHHTTSSCLMAIEKLARKKRFYNVLDMGSGSGILSIAAARVWRDAKILGIDIDEDSVTFSRKYAAQNNIKRSLKFYATDGYKSAIVKRAGKYDLIISNILARPLMKFARNLKRNLQDRGYVVLSGLTEKQQSMVLSAHRMQGLKLKQRIIKGGWATLILSNR